MTQGTVHCLQGGAGGKTPCDLILQTALLPKRYLCYLDVITQNLEADDIEETFRMYSSGTPVQLHFVRKQ